MSEGKKALKDVLNERNIKQIIVPEIQRDYVWKTDNVKKLLKSVIDDAKENAPKIDIQELEKLTPELRELAERVLEGEKVYSNIGFIYSYEDIEFKNRNFLIDGQQRLTTLYLLLLAVAIKSNKINYFKTRYFKDSLPKVDYKVRESSHNFLVYFIQHLLEGNSINSIESQYWYFTNYNNDKTIISLIKNYKTIADIINEKEISLDYIENNIELWFFDISKSSQGEELYIYMNSRGEEVISNENIKAHLLENCSDQDKYRWGLEWESWQDFFWKKRGGNPNADAGFNEFLKWIFIIQSVKLKREHTAEELGKFIISLRHKDKFSADLLTIDVVGSYFRVVQALHNKNLLDEKWLNGKTNTIDYFRFFPALLYAEKYIDFDKEKIMRLLRFFRNISKVEDISKNPDTQTVNSIRLMLDFLNDNCMDVIDLLRYRSTSIYQTILSEEECYKLSLYQNPPENSDRYSLENIIWKAEDNQLLNGKIDFILYCSNILMSNPCYDFNINKFKGLYNSFKELVNDPKDNFRRALLTIGDYTIDVGYSTHLSATRYSFGYGKDEWKRLINTNHTRKQLKIFLNDYYIKQNSNNLSSGEVLANIIENFLTDETNLDKWYTPFIKSPKLLRYCENKKICLKNTSLDNIFLLKKKKATTYKKLSEFLC